MACNMNMAALPMHCSRPPANADNHCAQPGLGVNTYTYGSWCRCLKPPHPAPGPPPKDLDHPLDGKSFYFYDTFDNLNLYIGFPTDSSAPPNEPSGSKQQSWFRSTVADQKDACPLKLGGVAGKRCR